MIQCKHCGSWGGNHSLSCPVGRSQKRTEQTMSEPLDLELVRPHEVRFATWDDAKAYPLCDECDRAWPCDAALLRSEVERLRTEAANAREQRAAAWDAGQDAVTSAVPDDVWFPEWDGIPNPYREATP